mgnify:FL=1
MRRYLPKAASPCQRAGYAEAKGKAALRKRLGAVVLFFSCMPLGIGLAGELPQAGKIIAEERCARCHAIGPADESRLPEAPAFRELHQRYPVEHLAEALAEGIEVGHKAMPEFVLDPNEIDALLAYLKTLE